MGLPMDDHRRNSDSKTTRPAKLESRTGGKGLLIEGVLDPGYQPLGEPEPPGLVAKPGDGARHRFPLVKFADVLMSTTAVYLVKGLIPRTGIVVIWGPPKCGKSFLVFDLLMRVSLGWEYRGLRTKQGPVVCCVLEGKDGYTRRIAAFRKKHPESKDAPFYLVRTPLDLIRDHKALIASIRAQLPEGDNPSAVAIDTLNRSLVGSESSDEDMAAYVRAADAIHDAFGCVVPIIHHCGHNADRPRGHSSLLGAADVLIAVKRDAANNIVATVEWEKDGAGGLEIVSQLVTVEVGKDEDGDMMTSCVVEPVGEPAAAKKGETKKGGLTNATKLALRALHAAIGDVGEIPATSHAPSGMRAVTLKHWREFCDRTGVSGSDKPHSRAAAFKRASDALQMAGKIGIWEPHVWPVHEEHGK